MSDDFTPITDVNAFTVCGKGIDGGKRVVSVHIAEWLEQEKRAALKALALIADDCEAWLVGDSDEPSADFIKLVAKYAREASLK